MTESPLARATKVLIVRHGNTFDKGDVVTRVGKHTNLPLSSSGKKQAKHLGHYLAQHHGDLAAVFTSSLLRTQQTAEIALKAAQLDLPTQASGDFDEIDYGPDENKPEAEVVARVGAAAIQAWETQGTPPADWKVNPEGLKQTWRDFFEKVCLDYAGKTIMVVTSNGIARFAPYCLKDFDQWQTTHQFKMRTGALSLFSHQEGVWQCEHWNLRPDKKRQKTESH
jgi:probable phosphoglycerate mutase